MIELTGTEAHTACSRVCHLSYKLAPKGLCGSESYYARYYPTFRTDSSSVRVLVGGQPNSQLLHLEEEVGRLLGSWPRRAYKQVYRFHIQQVDQVEGVGQ